MAERGITRRKFMLTGALGVGTLGLAGVSASASAAKAPAVAPKIVYRTLGMPLESTGRSVPVKTALCRSERGDIGATGCWVSGRDLTM